jgi:signal transduction histidine kinase
MIKISVEDTGIGMNVDKIKNIFKAFNKSEGDA